MINFLRRVPAALATLFFLMTPFAVKAEVVTLPSVQDNTLYETEDGSLSNGAGRHFFVGRVDVLGAGLHRRGLIAFDVAGNIPPGSTITGVKLTLNMSRTVVGPEPVSLFLARASWGEGTSNATGGEGEGAPSTAGDATWMHRFFDTVTWTSKGGDFDPSASATLEVNLEGSYTWESTAGMVADVQDWLDSPENNFGWTVIGNEDTFPTAKRFDSRENVVVDTQPVLAVEFTPPIPVSGSVPDGNGVAGMPLVATLAEGGAIRLDWSPSCLSTDDDYEIYVGRIGDFAETSPISCSTGGETSALVTPPTDDSVFIVIVPRNLTLEGSYGSGSDGILRLPSAQACLPQAVISCQ